MSIKKAYYYLFYKLYRHFQNAPSVWWSEWKATLALDVLVLLIPLSGLVYYMTFVDRHLDLSVKYLGLFVGAFVTLFVVLPNYFIFNHKDQWRDIVNEFDQFPKKKNRIGGWIVWIIIFALIANLIFSYYLLYHI